MEHVVTVRTGRISQVNYRHLVPVFFLCDTRIVSEQVSLGVRREEAHPAGTGIFDVRIEEVGSLADARRTDHQAVHIIPVDDSVCSPMPFLTPDQDPLNRRKFVSLPPLFRFKPYLHIGILNLLLGCHPRRAVLPVPDGLSLDAIQLVAA